MFISIYDRTCTVDRHKCIYLKCALFPMIFLGKLVYHHKCLSASCPFFIANNFEIVSILSKISGYYFPGDVVGSS